VEFKKWCPAFKLLTYYGSAKERKAKRQGWSKPNAFHIAITSYTLILQVLAKPALAQISSAATALRMMLHVHNRHLVAVTQSLLFDLCGPAVAQATKYLFARHSLEPRAR
jgi:SNF2 family DNA or RNA helicase